MTVADLRRRELCTAGLAGLAAILACRLLLGPGGTWGWPVATLCFGLVWLLVGRQMQRRYPHAHIGACNAITLIRAALASALIAPLLAGHATGWPVALIGAVALALDGADGWAARWQGLVSDFGARFDMETDSLLAMVLSLHLVIGTEVGAEGLILGFARHVFVGAALIWPWLGGPLPQRFRRKAICVVQLAVLIGLQLPFWPADAAILLTRLAAALVIWSFAVDILWLRERAA